MIINGIVTTVTTHDVQCTSSVWDLHHRAEIFVNGGLGIQSMFRLCCLLRPTHHNVNGGLGIQSMFRLCCLLRPTHHKNSGSIGTSMQDRNRCITGSANRFGYESCTAPRQQRLQPRTEGPLPYVAGPSSPSPSAAPHLSGPMAPALFSGLGPLSFRSPANN